MLSALCAAGRAVINTPRISVGCWWNWQTAALRTRRCREKRGGSNSLAAHQFYEVSSGNWYRTAF